MIFTKFKFVISLDTLILAIYILFHSKNMKKIGVTYAIFWLKRQHRIPCLCRRCAYSVRCRCTTRLGQPVDALFFAKDADHTKHVRMVTKKKLSGYVPDIIEEVQAKVTQCVPRINDALFATCLSIQHASTCALKVTPVLMINVQTSRSATMSICRCHLEFS